MKWMSPACFEDLPLRSSVSERGAVNDLAGFGVVFAFEEDPGVGVHRGGVAPAPTAFSIISRARSRSRPSQAR